MTRLLVSVRDVEEARDAWQAGAQLIDLKDPSRGPLAACPVSTWRDVLSELSGVVPLSVALGELAETDVVELAGLTAGFQFAKVGLSGCRTRPDWLIRWRAWRNSLPPAVTPVAVVYADHQSAGAPPPLEVLNRGQEIGCRALLIDTFAKDGRSLYAHLTREEIVDLSSAARHDDMLVVLGGSLRRADLPQTLELSPDYVAVRGAVCPGPRHSRLAPTRVAEWVLAITQNNKATTPAAP